MNDEQWLRFCVRYWHHHPVPNWTAIVEFAPDDGIDDTLEVSPLGWVT